MKNNNKLLACPYIIWMILFTIIPLSVVMLIAAIFISPKPKGKPLSEEPENHQ